MAKKPVFSRFLRTSTFGLSTFDFRTFGFRTFGFRTFDFRLSTFDFRLYLTFIPIFFLAAMCVQAQSTWYDPAAPCLKILTKQDGIARLRFDEVNAVESTFAGKKTANLRLWYNGNEEKILVLHDTDSVFNTGDELIFQAHRPEGDTTWFNTYSTEAAIFLTFDAQKSGARYSALPTFPATELISSVKIIRHFEEDKQYWLGNKKSGMSAIEQERTHTIEGEGWYWRLFTFGTQLDYTAVATPSDDGKIGEFRFHIGALSDNLSFSPDHLFEFYLNNTLRYSSVFNGFKDSIFRFSVDNSAILSGSNRLSVKAPGVAQYRSQPSYTEYNGMDYYEVETWEKPFAWKGFLAGNAVLEGGKNAMDIVGFPSNTAVVLAPKQGIGGVLNADKEGVTVRFGVQFAPVTFASVSVNDSTYIFSADPALYLVSFNSSVTPPVQFLKFTDVVRDSASILTFLKIYSASTLVCLAYNGTKSFPVGIRTFLESVGATQSEKSGSGAWLCAYRKESGYFTEKFSPEIASFSDFIPFSGGKSYSTKVSLAESSAFIAMDFSSLYTPRLERVAVSMLADSLQQADALIITHSAFRKQAQELADYRAQTEKIGIKVVDVEDIYKEFGHGQKSPQAIKNFLQFSYERWRKPAISHVILFGDASWDARKVSSFAVKTDFIPSYGFPVSDFWYGYFPERSVLPHVILGRLPVETESEASAIVEKIKKFEATPRSTWHKRFFFITGGGKESEIVGFRQDAMSVINEHVFPPPLCARIDTVFRAMKTGTIETIDTTRKAEIRKIINDGVIFLNYFGHGAPVIFDMDYGKASELNNAGKFGFLATFSCATAAFAEPDAVSKNEELVREKDKGFVAAIGATGLGLVIYDQIMESRLYDSLRFRNIRRIGDLMYASKIGLLNESEINGWNPIPIEKENALFQQNLLGDPFLRIPIDTLPDVFVLSQYFSRITPVGSSVSENDQAVSMRGIAQNGGLGAQDTLLIAIIHEYDTRRDTIWRAFPEICGDIPFDFSFNVFGKPGYHYYTVLLDPFKHLTEANTANNILRDSVFVLPNAGVNSVSVYPNPFRERVTLSFTAKIETTTSVGKAVISDALGREVRTLNFSPTTGVNSVDWDGADANGTLLLSGVYVVRMNISDGNRQWSETLQCIILR